MARYVSVTVVLSIKVDNDVKDDEIVNGLDIQLDADVQGEVTDSTIQDITTVDAD